MKKVFVTIALAILVIVSASAQTQSGYVKTKGRMDKSGNLIPGTRIGGAAITLTGGHSTVADANGNFKIAVPDKKFFLKSVQKQGYALVDPEILKKQYVQSANPLVITMETPEKQLEDQLKSERKLRRDLQKRLQQREQEVDSLLEQGKISEEEHLKALQNIYAEQTINEKLISEMAKRYSEIDYDLLDEFYRQVTFFIESGDLVKADSLLQTRGNLIQQVEEQKRKAAAIQKEEEQLQKAKEVYMSDNEELARRCYSYYEKFLAQYQVDSAIYYIELRAELDTTNVDWQLEVAPILDSMDLYDKAILYLQRAGRHCTAKYGDDSYVEAMIIGMIGVMYYKKRDFTSALECYQKSLSLSLGANIKDDSGQDTCQESAKWWVPACYNRIGEVYEAMTEYALAVEYYQKAMDRCQLYGEDSLYYKALCFNNIGDVFAEVAQYVLALEYYQKALDIFLLVSGETSSEVASSYNDMGNVYYYMQEYSAALKSYMKYLHIYEDNTLKNSYSSIGLGYMGIGNVYVKLREYGLGKEYLSKALDILQSCYGEYDPMIALLYNNIGGLFREQSKGDLAMEYYSESLKIRKVVFGESHPKIAESYHNIGAVFFDTDSFENAIEYEKKALNIWKSFYGISYPFVSTCYSFILDSYHYLNRLDLAVVFFNNELADMPATVDSSDAVKIYQFLGDAYSYQGDYSKAIDNYKKALPIFIANSGENHIDVAKCYYEIGLAFYNQSDYSKAIDNYKKALPIFIANSGENPINVAICYYGIGLAFYYQSDYSKAIDYYKKALPIFIANSEEDPINVATCYKWIGFAYYNQSDYSKAIDYLKKALPIFIANSGKDSINVATCYNWIGFAYYNLQNYSKTIEYYEKVLVIRKSLYGENHVDVADSYNRIGVAYSFLKKYTEASDNYEKALAIRKSLLGENHPDTKQVYDNIKSTQYRITFLDTVAMKQHICIATTVEGETPAKAQGLSGEYVVLEFGEWSIDSTSSLYDVNDELRGKPKTILIMKDDVISQHYFENTIGILFNLKQVGEEEKNRIKELYHQWKREH